ncbi:hypothetical protein OROMI_030641 [Orobanche minor]
MYGLISRTRMEPDGVAFINFRSNESAQSAVDASRDSSCPVTLHSTPVQVMWANDPVPQWKGGVRRKDGLSSKLMRPELPLSRHGRGNKLGSAIVIPRDDNNTDKDTKGDANDGDKLISSIAIGNSIIEGLFRGREIVAYDDIL